MAKQKRHGTCHLCGCNGQLSFEHVPPEAAFNDHKVLLESRDAGQERIFLGLYDLAHSKASRQSGITGRVDGHGGIQVFSEISFPPFNLVSSASGGSPDPGLVEITWFKEFAYGESADISLTLRNLAVNSVFPADYRTVDEIKRQAEVN
jgi:hypothetical protein